MNSINLIFKITGNPGIKFPIIQTKLLSYLEPAIWH